MHPVNEPGQQEARFCLLTEQVLCPRFLSPWSEYTPLVSIQRSKDTVGQPNFARCLTMVTMSKDEQCLPRGNEC